MSEITEKINDIINSKALTRDDFHSLILSTGLNNEYVDEQPPELAEYFGRGLKIWQYPNQFSEFLEFIRTLNVKSYMEVGCRHGGTFVLVSETLKRGSSNKDFSSTACDLIEMSPTLRKYYDISKTVDYWTGSSRTEAFKKFALEKSPEFVFIDGDHSYAGVKSDFSIFENNKETKYIVLHDIVNQACPGVVKMWNEIKADSRFETREFTKQYLSVPGTFLGIGIAIRK